VPGPVRRRNCRSLRPRPGTRFRTRPAGLAAGHSRPGLPGTPGRPTARRSDQA
jgi:hypothetical protein